MWIGIDAIVENIYIRCKLMLIGTRKNNGDSRRTGVNLPTGTHVGRSETVSNREHVASDDSVTGSIRNPPARKPVSSQ